MLFNKKTETNNPTLKTTNKLQFNYHRIPETAEIDKVLWRSSCPNPQLKQGHLQPVAQDCVQTFFEYLWGWRLHSLTGWAVAMLGQSQSEKGVFWCADRVSCVSLCAYCFLPYHLAYLKRAGFTFFTPLYFTCTLSPWNFILQKLYSRCHQKWCRTTYVYLASKYIFWVKVSFSVQ